MVALFATLGVPYEARHRTWSGAYSHFKRRYILNQFGYSLADIARQLRLVQVDVFQIRATT